MRAPACRGHTLVELIVATAITLVLAGLLLTVTAGILRSWNLTRGKLMTSNQSKWALDQLKQDLQEAVIRFDDGNTWFAATIMDLDAGTNLASHGWAVSAAKPQTVDVDEDVPIAECRFGRGGMWLRLVGKGQLDVDDDEDPSTPLVTISAPAVIAYQIVRKSGTGQQGYGLYRSVVAPDATFGAGYNLDPAAGNAYATPDNSADGLPGNIISPNQEQLIAPDVIDFGLRFYVSNGATETMVFPNGSASYFLPRDGMPNRVEILLRILTPEGAQRIARLEGGLESGDWWEIALAHSQTYTARVSLLQRSF